MARRAAFLRVRVATPRPTRERDRAEPSGSRRVTSHTACAREYLDHDVTHKATRSDDILPTLEPVP